MLFFKKKLELIELKLNFLRTINNSLPFQAWILIYVDILNEKAAYNL